MSFFQFLKSKKFYLISLVVLFGIVIFCFTVSPTWAAPCEKTQKGFSFISFLNPILSLIERITKDFGYQISLAAAPDPDFCGSDIVVCVGKPYAIISWEPAPSSVSGLPLSYYVLSLREVGNYNTGLSHSYTVGNLSNNTTYHWSVEAYYNGVPSTSLGVSNQPYGSFTTPTCFVIREVIPR